MASIKSLLKISSLAPRNKDFCMEWSWECIMTNMKTVLFTDESRASPNDTDGLTKGWVFNGDNDDLGRNDWKQDAC